MRGCSICFVEKSNMYNQYCQPASSELAWLSEEFFKSHYGGGHIETGMSVVYCIVAVHECFMCFSVHFDCILL